ncbi:hypothetical protein DL96DRAFT_1216364 [Flagelloscypha sp. PMI_526]|nr:hypothetical protein DL96DRAFT_1216364 [Flagelloscypha sp. PMI_526]
MVVYELVPVQAIFFLHHPPMFPTELLLSIVQLVLLSPDVSTEDRIQAMTSLPLVCRRFRDILTAISSTHLVIPTQPYLFALLYRLRMDVAFQRPNNLAQTARTIHCFVDHTERGSDPAMSVYTAFCRLQPGMHSLKECFPLVSHIELRMSFRLLSPKHQPWTHKPFFASVRIPLSSQLLDPVVYEINFSSDERRAYGAKDQDIQSDLLDIYLTICGPRPSNLLTPIYCFPGPTLVITNTPQGDRTIVFRSSHRDSTEPFSSTLQHVLDLTAKVIRLRTMDGAFRIVWQMLAMFACSMRTRLEYKTTTPTRRMDPLEV